MRAAEDERDHPRENHQEGKEHLGEGGDEGRASRGGHRLGRHRPLHDEKVRAPVAKRQHEAESHHEPEPLDANGILRGAPHCPPGVGIGVGGKAARRRDRRELRRQAVPPANGGEPEPDEREKAEDDEEELKHLVVNRAR